MLEEPMPKQKIYYSYTRQDERIRKALSAHLSTLKRSKLITTWFTGKIQPGSDRQREIETHFDAADIILPLMSSDYFDSDEKFAEWQRTLERAEADKAKVLPIIARACHWPCL